MFHLDYTCPTFIWGILATINSKLRCYLTYLLFIRMYLSCLTVEFGMRSGHDSGNCDDHSDDRRVAGSSRYWAASRYCWPTSAILLCLHRHPSNGPGNGTVRLLAHVCLLQIRLWLFYWRSVTSAMNVELCASFMIYTEFVV